MPEKEPRFDRESDLCAAFMVEAKRQGWTAYAETAGFDILLANADGLQIGVEAKLALNMKVFSQARAHVSSWNVAEVGPDYRAVLVPDYAKIGDVAYMAAAFGIKVLRQAVPDERGRTRTYYFSFPTARYSGDDWHEWCPLRRCKLPDYVPDVVAGASAPVALTAWKVQAIKLAIVLAERPITRADFKALGISPSRWTDPWAAWLTPTPLGYVAGPKLPDFKAQHPVNYEQIKSDRAKWDWSPATLLDKSGAA